MVAEMTNEMRIEVKGEVFDEIRREDLKEMSFSGVNWVWKLQNANPNI